ncbi:hypothetical protein IU427_06175 [Nocardia beijingensis]|uniref:hypothetical protein n=1 Tax=Nocardia beijingensis TaxID=95162 RepID=UPI001892F3CA|nr:hypothetical protein [Nocardia beijingensis]MBF6464771.1 hypothetical protein [Nocardia beijingensis]
MVMVPVVAAAMWWQVPADREAAKTRITEQRTQNILRATNFPHDPHDRDLGIHEAHMTMQRHRGCRADECPRKAAARQVLISAGRMKPDTSREY